ncbi:MAG: hypothetical protein UT42_C0001G0013 [Candidatus Falkowbacteria bacterium GW2011_GWA2_39_24]|uniref:Uncharacterized protein n=1 Tax=Candidatus Falkowbacteria bacterium GW2011_GWA2_39_24 TaxID=1618634 RepID=A0A0G0NRN7_9BACT|nr:MAG: hypothetical protein UT42_C0001G0013 [Candidatus Falkowbacteria bacterium GW2011_GWA2_39_24]
MDQKRDMGNTLNQCLICLIPRSKLPKMRQSSLAYLVLVFEPPTRVPQIRFWQTPDSKTAVPNEMRDEGRPASPAKRGLVGDSHLLRQMSKLEPKQSKGILSIKYGKFTKTTF